MNSRKVKERTPATRTARKPRKKIALAPRTDTKRKARPTTRAAREAERIEPERVVCNEKELAFIDHWMRDFNGTRAIIDAGIHTEPRTAATYASEWLNRAHVLDEIQARRQARAAQLEHTAERLMEEQLAVALASISDVMRWTKDDATLVPRDDLRPDQLAAIAEVTMIPGMFGTRMSVRMHNKLDAIAALQKQLMPSPAEIRRGAGRDAGTGITIYVDGGPTGLEVDVRKSA